MYFEVISRKKKKNNILKSKYSVKLIINSKTKIFFLFKMLPKLKLPPKPKSFPSPSSSLVAIKLPQKSKTLLIPSISLVASKVSPKPKTFRNPSMSLVIRPKIIKPSVVPVYKNLNVILEGTDQTGALYLGDISAAMEKTKMKQREIKTVFTIAMGMNIHYNPAIKHHVIPAFDHELFDLEKYFDGTFESIENGLKNGGVLVHCAAGISRSATIVIAYLMKKNKWTYQESYSFVKKKRSVIGPNSGFVRQLRNYEKRLKN